MKRLWTAVPVVALGLLSPLLPTAAQAAVAAPLPAKTSAVASAAAKSSACHVESVVHFKGAHKQYFNVYSATVCSSSQHFIGVAADFSGGGFFEETRKKCYGTSRCTVVTPWMHNPKGSRTYCDAVVGNNKKHWYSIISYELAGSPSSSEGWSRTPRVPGRPPGRSGPRSGFG